MCTHCCASVVCTITAHACPCDGYNRDLFWVSAPCVDQCIIEVLQFSAPCQGQIRDAHRRCLQYNHNSMVQRSSIATVACLQVPIVGGSDSYIQWIGSQVHPTSKVARR